MASTTKIENTFLKDLGDGLILRRATPSDGEALAAFNHNIHRHDDTGEPDERVAVWTRDLVERPHPTFNVGDFTLVEDTKTGAIVSSMNLISQVWSYAGVEFKVGRPELVGTEPTYRERGLVRAQFEVIHGWSEGRGELLQAITGIPYYYRLFGYEMALALGGGRAGFKPHIPRLKEGEKDPYRLRQATEADIGFLAKLYQLGAQRSLVSCVRDEALWRYEIAGKSARNVNRSEVRMIETLEGEPTGYLLHPPDTWGPMLAATGYEVKPGVSWAAVTPTVIRYLEATGKSYTSEDGKQSELEAFGFWLGAEHPVYQVIADKLPRVRKPYAWYLRVPDLPAFVRRISPVLEGRLADSPLFGHSGELKVSFYNRGLRMIFDAGRLVEVESWKPAPQGHSGDAGFPGLTFLQLLFGYRSLVELQYAFADCWTGGDEPRALLEILFPKQASDVWPLA
jgi:hypothetical protein